MFLTELREDIQALVKSIDQHPLPMLDVEAPKATMILGLLPGAYCSRH